MTQPDFWIESQPPCPAIVFNFSQSLPEEIARFDSKGFYYKGKFVDDAGEVHRLLKQVLEGQLNIATPPPEPPTEQKSLIDELIAGCKPLDPEMAEALTTDARWRLFGEDDRAALATEPVWEGLSIDDIRQLCVDNELLMFVDSGDFDTVVVAIMEIVCAALARWGRPATPPPKPPTDDELWAVGENYLDDIDRTYAIAFARATLKRWGR